MLVESPQYLLTWLVVAILLDAVVGDPGFLWRRLPHPVVLIGRVVTGLEAILLDQSNSHSVKRNRGGVLVGLIVAGALLVGFAIHLAALALPHGWLAEAAVAGVLLAQRSLSDHVLAVARALDRGPEPARAAVAMIVGRDPEHLDASQIGRAAIESTAENFSDGVVAPLFWAAVLGLPGMLAYKAINTMDSMIGHKNQRYLDFGRCAARLDDLVNLPASRLSAIFVVVAAAIMGGTAGARAWRTVLEDAGRHRSPNAGWPEAAFAGALEVRLAGPRTYGGVPVVGDWIGRGREILTAHDIRGAVRLLWFAWAVALMVVAGGWWLTLHGLRE